jgi:hypothetical protein
MRLDQLINRRRDAWDFALAARTRHMRQHASAVSWHPLGSPERHANDLRAAREYARLDAEERETRNALASAMRLRGKRPLMSGLFEEFTREASV